MVDWKWLAATLLGILLTTLGGLAAVWSAAAEDKVRAVAVEVVAAEKRATDKIEAAREASYPREAGMVLEANQRNILELLREIKADVKSMSRGGRR